MNNKEVREVLEREIDSVLEMYKKAINEGNDSKVISALRILKDSASLISNLKREEPNEERIQPLIDQLRRLPENQLIKTDDSMRGIGKTYTLAQYSKEIGVPILSHNKVHQHYIRNTCGLDIETIRIARGLVVGRVLVDEGFKESELIELVENKQIIIVGGYISDKMLNTSLVKNN